MREQKLTIPFENLGKLTICATDYSSSQDSIIELSNGIILENIDFVENTDNKTPIQYLAAEDLICFLEEIEYQILFESKGNDINLIPSITEINSGIFKQLGFNFGDSNSNKIGGFLNFGSYVGKSFLDVEVNGQKSRKIPIEVRSKKMDYINHYSAMIADLSQYATGLIFDSKSPLYHDFEIAEADKSTYYEDFMLLEYLFRYENLPSVCEYLFRNLYSRLDNYQEEVPAGFSQNIDLNSLTDIITNPENLHKANIDSNFSDNLNGYMPIKVNDIKYQDTIDVPENRFFKSFLFMIQDLIEKLLESSKEGYIQDKLMEFKNEIEYYTSNNIFRDISKMDYVPFNSQVLQKREGYKELFKYFIMLEFSFRMSWKQLSDNFQGHEKKIFELYEYWCYFKILEVLGSISGNNIYFEEIFQLSKDNWSISLKEGQKSLFKFDFEMDGKEIQLGYYYNLEFSRNSKFRSYSLKFRPDYTFLVNVAGNSYFIHFDAKYKSKEEVNKDYDDVNDFSWKIKEFKKEDIYKMHTYKDAILRTDGAYILYPGDKCQIFKETELEIPSVGALSLTPGNDEIEKNNLEIFIRKILLTLIK
ncbi:MAG: DUF2357 domain-containing protein [Methanobrevibacter sp.]|uniref:DUF2357 domain-containing protein n=1 Tax=Methanobrevibacter sp. TaxID=66852 RepID=UPI0026E0208B|nr:DUF2357 domain-containing protein [Methanobrevibacter sp.]MDO5848514.1 DUF2357 domain-containing protein [Methanobrevibacter sp.]